MRTEHSNRIGICVLAVALLAVTLWAAPAAEAQGVNLPRASQHATITQTVGMTEITIDYHRPLVGGRDIWGALVPYGQPWRAGANENTTITFSHDVTINGKALPAGTYGLHMMPNEGEWEVMFSSNSTSWGSFAYDPSEDVVRVKATPKASPFREALTYDFHEPKADSVVVAMEWEELTVPFEVGVDTKAVVLQSLKNEMRSLPGFGWQGPQQAAAYLAAQGYELEQAKAWIEQSIQGQENATNLATKAQVLTALGDSAGAEEAQARALEVATPLERHQFGRQLIAQGKTAEAMKVFEMNAERNPDVWFVHVGMARGLSAVGNYSEAAKHMDKAAEGAPEAQRAVYEGLADQLRSGEAI